MPLLSIILVYHIYYVLELVLVKKLTIKKIKNIYSVWALRDSWSIVEFALDSWKKHKLAVSWQTWLPGTAWLALLVGIGGVSQSWIFFQALNFMRSHTLGWGAGSTGVISKGVGDVGVEADVLRNHEEAIKALGHIDVVVLSAGVGWPQMLVEDHSIADFDSVMNTNVRGVLLWLKAVLPAFKVEILLPMNLKIMF